MAPICCPESQIHRPLRFASFIVALLVFTVPLSAGPRYALVIGNGAYAHVSALANPVNDASDVSATLENLGFEVTRLLDAGKGEIERAVDQLRASAARPGTEMALFYYSGHGVESEGINYLIPVTADISDEYQLMDQAVSLDRVVNAMDRGQAAFTMVVLDACRDNPFFRTRSAGNRGLAAMSGGGKGSMIVFATSPGEVALDGTGRNSPFSQAFMEHAPTPGVEISTLMRRINGTVQELTGGVQTPWFNASYTGEVFLSAAEDLADTSARTDAINEELAALEAEIERRQAEIAAARSQEEKDRLEAEQRRARAQEAAKRLQAEQLAQIEAQARRVLEQREAEDALRAQMEAQVEAQRVSLTRQAEERRAQLEELRKQSPVGSGVWEQLETIAGINRAIADINARFDETIARTEREVNALYDGRIEAIRENNPKEPWDTADEYEELIARLTAGVETERTAEIDRRRAELQRNRESELVELRERLEARKAALNGREFTLGASATTVHVARFSAEQKRFPMEVRASNDDFAFVVPLAYTIDSQDRTVLREEYYRVFSADQAGGLAGEITYTVFELYPDLWVLQPTQTRVVNLLEDDAELGRVLTSAGEMIVGTADGVERLSAVVRLESGIDEEAEILFNGVSAGTTDLVHTLPERDDLGTIRTEYRYPNGTRRTFALNVVPGMNATVVVTPDGVERRGMICLSGLVPETVVEIGSTRVPVPNDASTAIITVPDGTHRYSISGRWLDGETGGRVMISTNRNPVARMDLREMGFSVVGEVTAGLSPDLIDRGIGGTVDVYTSNGEAVLSGVRLSEHQTTLSLMPGEYSVAIKRDGDPYYSRIETVTVSAQRTTTIELVEMPLSVRYELEESRHRLVDVERKISRTGARRIVSWSLLSVGALSLGSAGFSYMRGQVAMDAYDSATTTAGVTAARADSERWGILFNVGAIAGAGSSLAGAGLLAFGPGRQGLIDQRNELNRRIDALSAEYARLQAENALYGREL